MGTHFSDQFQRLVDCLSEQREVYARVVEVLGTEKNFLILADIPSLIENNKLKEVLLAKSRAIERIRQVRTSELLKAMGQDPKDRPISEIIALLPKEMAKILIELQASLAKVLQQLGSMNSFNEKLINNAKRAIESGLNSMKGDAPESQVYKKQGKLDPGRGQGKIVSKEI
jgi:flagellar biosynthesis/type III secretory pathway chaperone